MFETKGFPPALRAPVSRALTFLSARLPLPRFPRPRPRRIDTRLRRFLGNSGKPAVLRRDYPNFAFPDFHRAVERFLDGRAAEAIASMHDESLTALLHGKESYAGDRLLNSATKLPWQTGFEQEEYFPLDCFWLVPAAFPAERMILRLRREFDPVISILEVAAPDKAAAEGALEVIRAIATGGSIYLRQSLDLAFPGGQPEGGPDGGQLVDLSFRAPEMLEEREVVLDPDIRDLIQELIFDFDAVSSRLPFHRIGRKRGVLFYGPPGTGKTHTTRFILSRLGNRTRLVCSGRTLRSAKAVAEVARMFSPAVVVLEDADLVFTDREINADNNNLGDFMDVLDGFARDDDVIFVLNTNSLDRMEDAIRNRPGRISQCIYMGAPGEALRARYIERLLELHHARIDRKEALVRRTAGCTQAFLKELIQRMIQRRLREAGPSEPEPIALTEADGLETLARMRASGGDKGRRVLGFDLKA